jgi:hypothetical protein
MQTAEANNPPKKGFKRIAIFLDTLLKIELIKGLSYPGYLQQPFQDLDTQRKNEWVEYTFEKVFALARAEARREVRRELFNSELGLIERRVGEFLNKSGFGGKI